MVKMPAQVCVDQYPSEARGCLRAYKMVQITDIFGKTRMRKVSLGMEYMIGLDHAKNLVNTARCADNEPGSIGAHFVIGL